MRENWTTTSMPDGTVEREFIGYAPVRQSVTRAAFKIAVAQTDLLADIENFIAQNLPASAPAAILWREASWFNRSDAVWAFFAPQIGLSSEQVDEIFEAAGAVDDMLTTSRNSASLL